MGIGQLNRKVPFRVYCKFPIYLRIKECNNSYACREDISETVHKKESFYNGGRPGIGRAGREQLGREGFSVAGMIACLGSDDSAAESGSVHLIACGFTAGQGVR